MRLLARHPLLDAATATGAPSRSRGRGRSPAGPAGSTTRSSSRQADQILVEAATAGADLDDLKLLAQAAYEAWRAREPDPEEDPAGRGFGDRYLLPRHHPGRRRADQGRPDPRVRRRRHRGPGGARQEPRPGGLPNAPGSATTTPSRRAASCSSAPRWSPTGPAPTPASTSPSPCATSSAMDGASVIEDTWLRARAGEHGYLAGQGRRGHRLRRPGRPGRDRQPRLGPHRRDDHPGHRRLRPRQRQDRAPRLPPEAWEALQYALARRAIRFVSGPGALASALRRSLLGTPLNTSSVILDVGYADTIPDADPQGRHRPRQGLRLARRLRPPPRRLRRPPRQAQETRRQDQHHRLRAVVPVPP